MKKRYWLNLLWAILLVVAFAMPLVDATPAYAGTATLILRPNAAGDVKQLTQYPSSGANWDKVDEVTADDSSTYVYRSGTTGGTFYDLYALSNHTAEEGPINYVKVYTRVSRTGGNPGGYERIKIGGTEYSGTGHALTGNFVTYSSQWNTNPGGGAWTWDDIDGLQAGVFFSVPVGIITVACTQVYVEVNYTLVIPTVATNAASSIETDATLSGNVTAINDDSITERGFVWDTVSRGNPGNVAPGDSDYDEYEDAGAGAGSFSGDITVSLGKMHYIRACAENNLGNWGYGNEVTLGVPLIVASDASNIAGTAARLNSIVSYDGGEVCQVRWGIGKNQSPADFDDYDFLVQAEFLGSYTTGSHPFYDVSGLLPYIDPNDTPYYYSVQIKNSTSTVTSTVEIDFITSTGVNAPTDLRATPSSTSVSLTWVKGSGSNKSVLRYRMDTYPTSYIDGQLVYQGTSSSYNFTGLTPGTTYYIAAWGKSGDIYSVGEGAQVLATTTAGVAGGAALEGPVEPSGWLSAVDYTNLENLPLIYDAVNNVADAIHMPKGNFWMILWIGGSVAVGFGFYRLTKGSGFAGLGALTVLLAFGWAAIKIPMWMPAFTFISCVAIIFVRKREVSG